MHRFKTEFYLIAATTLLSSGAFADALPLSVLGYNRAVHVNTPSQTPANPQYPVTFSGFGIGGGFAATVAGYNTTVWCVDSQLDINWGDNYQADLVKLPSVPTDPSHVRYGNLSGAYSAGNPTGWAEDYGSASNNQALFRYEVAAWLVSQYNGFPNGPVPDDTSALGLRNHAIQRAIWQTTFNGGSTSSFNPALTGDISTGATPGHTWVNDAETFVSNPGNASFFNNWAVMSGGVDSSGNFLSSSGSTAKQTYMVQLTPVPEPGSCAWLGVVLAGVFLAARRR